jgi:membrane carboxypeptidase/penicillin-binding protein
MGITTPLKEVFSLALGSCEVTLLDLTSSYGVLANQGIKVKSWMIDKISDEEGRVVYVRDELIEEVISPQLAYIMTSLLESVVNEGTGLGVRMRGIYYPVAGKTGTTDECADAWFIGYTPYIVCGVWVGFDEMKRIGKNATGGKIAVPIWVEMMKEMEKIGKIKYQKFREPKEIVRYLVCKICGKIATTKNENTRKEIFIRGKEPKDYCRGFHIIEEEL